MEDKRKKEILDSFIELIKAAKPEKQEMMLCFCEGAVSMSNMLKKEEEAKPA